MQRRAFTLIELLVVVAIIALLISILLPALSRSRDRAKAVVCASHLHSMGLAVTMYCQTNNNWLPETGYMHGGGTGRAAFSWFNTMNKEYNNVDVLRCPVDLSPYWKQPLGGTLRHTSYVSNFYVVVGGVDNPLYLRDKHAYNRLDWIKNPANTIFLAELVETDDALHDGYPVADHVHPEYWLDNGLQYVRQTAAIMISPDRHINQANYGLLDGHAEGLPFEKTFNLLRLEYLPDGFVDPTNWLFNKYDPTVSR